MAENPGAGESPIAEKPPAQDKVKEEGAASIAAAAAGASLGIEEDFNCNMVELTFA